MTDVSSLEPTPFARARGPSASRLGLPSRAKSALSAAVAIGLMGLTTGCQGESASPSASPSQSPSTSQIQTTGTTQSQSSTPSSASQIQSLRQTPSPTQSQSQSPTQSQSPSPIQSLIPTPTPSPSPSPSQSATAAASLPPASGLALAVRVNPDAAQPIISSDTGADLTSPINQPADVVGGAPATPAAPGPLPIFGAAAAFGASRQLRKRIKGHS